jgi:hypothetical protein
MTYFSNSTEADIFERNWCSRCRNWRDRSGEDYPGSGDGCPVMDAHFLLSGDMYEGSPPTPTNAYGAMALLIADTSPPGERRCHLFVEGLREFPKAGETR